MIPVSGVLNDTSGTAFTLHDCIGSAKLLTISKEDVTSFSYRSFRTTTISKASIAALSSGKLV